nr:hypothetical protein [Tanacetum cinerariifolium]
MEFSVPRTPQQNRIAKKKNRTLIKAARTMLADSLLLISFWAEAVNTACYVKNRVLVTKHHNKTPYELLFGRTPSIDFMRPFGCLMTILNTLDPLEKAGEENVQQYVLFPLWSSGSKNPQNTDDDAAFEVKEPEFKGKKPESEVHVSPSSSAKTKKHADKTTKEAKGKSHVYAIGPSHTVVSPTHEKSLYVDPSQYPDDPNMVALKDITYSDDEEDVGAEADFTNLETTITVSPILTTRVHKDHPVTQIIGDLSSATQTRKEPKRVNQALKDPSWIEAMQEELLQFKMQKEKGINYKEVFAPVVRIEAIRLFLAYASFMGFMVYQIDVKSAFLYGTIEEEVYVCQPPGFEDPDYPDKVYKVVKALYGLHQAPRAWYETLANYLLENGFQRGKIDQTLFIKKQKAFEKLMKDKFQMSSMGELTFFLGLQVKQKPDGVFISQDKYVAEILRKFGFLDGKSASTFIDTEKPLLKDLDGEDVDVHIYKSMIGSLMYLTSSRPDIMFAVCACARFQVTPKVSHLYAVKRIFRYLKGKPHLGLWYPKDSPFNLVAYLDSDYAGASLDRKSTTGGCQFLGCRLISGNAKSKQLLPLHPLRLRVNTPRCDEDRLEFMELMVNDVVRLQALIDRKKVITTEATVREALRLDDAESIDCLPNEEIFTELSRMGYEKPSTKLTFYKAFFSPQWKFLLHTILQCMSAKKTSWNECSSSMALAVICLSTGKGFSGVETPLFEGVIVAHQADDVADEVAAGVDVDDVPAADVEPTLPSPTPTTQPPLLPPELPSTSQNQDKIAQALEIIKLKKWVRKLEKKKKLRVSGLKRLWKVGTTQRIESSADTVMDDQEDASKQGEIIANIDADKDVTLEEVDVEKNADVEKDADVQGRPEERKEVVIRDPEETTTQSTVIHTESKSKDKGKWIMVQEPKPLKKQAQIEQDEAYARELEAKLNKNINWNDVIERVQRKEKKDNVVLRYQALKRKPQTEAQARKNIMIYLRNMAGFKMDYFKEMSYDDIRSIFEKYFNSNVAFLEKSKEQLEEKESRALKRQSKSLEEKAAKKQKLDEEVKELKKHLQIVLNDDDDDDVYTEATPLALKVPVVDYKIYTENNKPYYKIIRADGSHQLFLSFLSLLSNFDREDLEMLCKGQKLEIVRIPWSAYHNIYNYTGDLAGREKISIDKIHFRADAKQCKTSKIYTKGLLLLVKDLLLLVKVDAVG